MLHVSGAGGLAINGSIEDTPNHFVRNQKLTENFVVIIGNYLIEIEIFGTYLFLKNLKLNLS